MRIVFETNLKNERFDTDIEVILYRVVCELINNSLKHSGAARVDLSLPYQQGFGIKTMAADLILTRSGKKVWASRISFRGSVR